jgi:RNA binding exosome subunit
MVEQEKWSSDFKGLVVALTDTIAAQEAERLDAINEQLSALIDRFKAGLLGLGDENRECLARFTTTVGGFEVSMERLLENIRLEHEGLGARLVTLSGEFHGQQEKLGLQLSEQLGALGAQLSENMGALESLQLESAEKALVSIGRLDEVVKEQLVELGAGLGSSLQGVVESAEKAPRAAAEVLGKLQGRVEDQIQRENALLEERMILLEGLGEVATQLRGAAGAHGEAISAMTLKADQQLKQVAEHSRDELEQTRNELREAAELIGVGGHEMSVLTEMFSQAVSEYRTSNEQLLGGLDRVEEALSHAGERSDQQLNFYVSQAREILDHSMLSQKEVFDELKHLRLSQTVEENV